MPLRPARGSIRARKHDLPRLCLAKTPFSDPYDHCRKKDLSYGHTLERSKWSLWTQVQKMCVRVTVKQSLSRPFSVSRCLHREIRFSQLGYILSDVICGLSLHVLFLFLAGLSPWWPLSYSYLSKWSIQRRRLASGNGNANTSQCRENFN